MKQRIIITIFASIFCVLTTNAQTIKIPKKNTATGNIATIYIPRRVKIEKEVKKIDEVISQELNAYTQQMRDNNQISESIETNVKADVVEEVNETTGEKELNLKVEYQYQVVKASLGSVTDDFAPGKYTLASSNAARITMTVLKKTIEEQLAEYLTGGTKVTVRITGSTDGTPISGKIPYTGEFGEFDNEMCFINGVLDYTSITKASGITKNEQLAFLRTYSVRDFIERFISPLQITTNNFEHYAIVAKERGAQYRRISVEILIHDAFRNKFAEEKEAVADNSTPPVAIEEPKLQSDIDLNIPVTGASSPKTYALIIGNEDYATYNKGLNTEVNVDFAINDAEAFAQYCQKTLGIPEKQIKLLTNATAGQMSDGIDWISYMAELEAGAAELVFYYSGHGLPDEATQKPYLIPVDVSGTNLKYALLLTEVYEKLQQHPAKRITVFLDACFSGGGRNASLVAAKAIKVKPKEGTVDGNMVVFTSSSGEESSAVYREKYHGYFTYFLLKKWQDTKGEATYKELYDYVLYNVQKETAIVSKKQTPGVQCAPALDELWRDWHFK